MRKKSDEHRGAEWLLYRKTLALGDIIDEYESAKMLGITVHTFRDAKYKGHIFGLDFPEPIFSSQNKSIWLMSEMQDLARKHRAKRAARRKR
jgi:hypothetical protein